MPHCAGTPRGWQYLHSVLGGQVRGIPPAVEQGDEPKATRQIPGEPLRCLGCRHHLHHSRDAGVVQRGVEVNGLEERQEGSREGISELLAAAGGKDTSHSEHCRENREEETTMPVSQDVHGARST